MDEKDFLSELQDDDQKYSDLIAGAEHFIRLKKQAGIEKNAGAMDDLRRALARRPMLRSAVISGAASGILGAGLGAANAPPGYRSQAAIDSGIRSGLMGAAGGALLHHLSTKLAEDRAKLDSEEKKNKGPRIGEGMAGGLAGAIAPSVVGSASLHTIKSPSVPVAEKLRNVERMGKEMGIDWDSRHGAIIKGKVGLSNQPAVLKVKNPISNRTAFIARLQENSHPVVDAHEIGHMVNYKKYPGLLKAKTSLGRLSNLSTVGTSAWAAGQEDPSWIPGLANAALHAPTLVDEGMATSRALAHLKRTGGTGTALRGAGKMILPSASYLLNAGLPLGITAWRKHKEKKQMNKEANIKDMVRNIDPIMATMVAGGALTGGLLTRHSSLPREELGGKSKAEDELEASVEANKLRPETGLLQKMHNRDVERMHGWSKAFREHPNKAALLGALTGAVGGYGLGRLSGAVLRLRRGK